MKKKPVFPLISMMFLTLCTWGSTPINSDLLVGHWITQIDLRPSKETKLETTIKEIIRPDGTYSSEGVLRIYSIESKDTLFMVATIETGAWSIIDNKVKRSIPVTIEITDFKSKISSETREKFEKKYISLLNQPNDLLFKSVSKDKLILTDTKNTVTILMERIEH